MPIYFLTRLNKIRQGQQIHKFCCTLSLYTADGKLGLAPGGEVFPRLPQRHRASPSVALDKKRLYKKANMVVLSSITCRIVFFGYSSLSVECAAGCFNRQSQAAIISGR
jgi:hypothetical protein